ncbi:MAG: PAS domain-containing sensor histidine kinase [Usitatibacter sp.]
MPLEGLIGAIVESAMDAIITVDQSQRIVVFNSAAERVFGWTRAEVLGAPLYRLIPERLRKAHEGHIGKFGQGVAASRRMAGARIVQGLRRNGEEFPIEASISHVAEGGRLYFTVILRDVTERVRSEAELERSREELHEFAVATNTVREQEKTRIARELHDELGQTLTALKIDLGWIRERVKSDGEAVVKLASMQGLLDSTVASTRRISSDLRPLMLDDLGLVAACEWLVHSFRARTGKACSFEMTGDLELADPYATAIFRVLQESLTNVTKHAEATQVAVSLGRSDGKVALSVKDNGRGFSESDARKPNSYGLIGMRERAYVLGGIATIESTPRGGTLVRLEFSEAGTSK